GFIFLIILIFAHNPICNASDEKLTLTNLRCDDRLNPLGIESESPRLSWIIQAAHRDVKQTAYRILVSDDPEMLRQGTGNIWDTGKINAGTSIQVSYAGSALAPATKYYWQVKIWDNQGQVSDWSEPASWQLGLPAMSDWMGAQWIGYDERAQSDRIVPAAHGGGKPE